MSYVLIAFFFAIGIWLGIWMSQLEDKYKYGKKVKIKKTLVEQILTKAGIDHTGIQINALEGELRNMIEHISLKPWPAG